MAIAEHVMSLHFAENRLTEAAQGVNVNMLRKYISFCRQRCAPCLTADASVQLAQEYVKIREGQRKRTAELDSGSSTIPITVRQLEAVVRVSEALAKLQLSREVTADHVKEAVRLFKASTLSAARAGSYNGEGSMTTDQAKEVQTVEDDIKRRVSIGSHVSVRAVVDEFLRRVSPVHVWCACVHVHVWCACVVWMCACVVCLPSPRVPGWLTHHVCAGACGCCCRAAGPPRGSCAQGAGGDGAPWRVQARAAAAVPAAATVAAASVLPTAHRWRKQHLSTVCNRRIPVVHDLSPPHDHDDG